MSLLQQEPRRRNRVMCKNCRHDKQRCEPRQYDWYQGERCERCKKLDYDCSPPEKKERAKGKQKNTEPPATSPVPAAVFDGMLQRFNSDDRIFPSPDRVVPPKDPNIQMAKQNGQLPMVPWFDNTHGDNVAGDSDTPASEDFTQVGQSGEVEGRNLVAKLGTLLVIRILFEQDLLFLLQIQEWIGPSPYIDMCRAAFQDFIGCVTDESRKLRERAMAIVLEKKHMGSYDKEAFLEDVGNLVDKLHEFRRPPIPNCAERRADAPGDFFHTTRYRLQKNQRRKHIFSAAALMTKAAHDCMGNLSDFRRESDATQVMNFQQAGEDIRKALSEIQLHDPNHDRIFFGPLNQPLRQRSACIYLPSHLAARNSTETIVKQLWTESSASPWELDCFLRTPVHYAAYYACISSLETIFKHDEKLVADLRPDRFGMSPLVIAACKDDLKSFRLLVKYGASMDVQVNGMSILTLAARNGSVRIVKYMLDVGRLPLSLTSELTEATERGHSEVVQLLVQKYTSMQRDDYSLQVNQARNIAQTMGEHDLADALMLQYPMPSINQAVVSLQNLHHDSANANQEIFDREQAFAYEDSQDSSISELWDYNISSSTLADRYGSAQSFESMPFDEYGVDWFDSQNPNPSDYIDD